MSESLLFLTGKLAEKSLQQVLASIQPTPFKYRVTQIGVSVAALMTPELIVRRLQDVGDATQVIVPGLCCGDLTILEDKYGVPVARGPVDLKDLPQYFGRGGKVPDLTKYEVNIFAEIVDAPQLSLDDILARALHFKAQGANIIDLGCLPNTPFPHLADAIKLLKKASFKSSLKQNVISWEIKKLS